MWKMSGRWFFKEKKNCSRINSMLRNIRVEFNWKLLGKCKFLKLYFYRKFEGCNLKVGLKFFMKLFKFFLLNLNREKHKYFIKNI